MQIIPAIMEKEFPEFEGKVGMLPADVRWLQVDVTDGVFCEGKTFELELVNKVEERLQRLWDIHLMVKEPKNWIEKCQFVQASRIVGQVEMMSDRERFVRLVHEAGMEAGISFDVETPIEDIPQETELVLVMGRKAGFGYKPIEERVFQRVRETRKIQNEGKYKFQIAVDGGVSLENIKRLKEAGAEIFYVTAAIFKGKVENNLGRLREEIE